MRTTSRESTRPTPRSGHNHGVLRLDTTRHRPGLGDAVALTLAWALSVTVILVEPDAVAQRRPIGILIATAAAVVLALGSRFPRATMLVVGVLDVVVLGLTSSPLAIRPIVVVALYRTVRESGSRREALLFAVPVAVAVAGAGASVGDESFLFEWLTDTAVLLLPIAAAEAHRANVERQAAAVEREVAEQLHAERLRIANDLHDIVAHSLSAIAVQSGIASHLFDRNPDAARDALDEINLAGRRALDELRILLGVLRSADAAPMRPVPSDPDQLADVIAGAAVGLRHVEVMTEGSYPDDVAESTVVTVHRIVHESLVNVARHAGDVPTRVHLEHADDGVRVTVTNDPAPLRRPAAPSTGVGIVAMRERTEVLGGWVRAGNRSGGGFEVMAFVPYHRAEAVRPQ